MRVRDLSIGSKMGAIAAFVLVLLILVGWQGLRGLVNQSEDAKVLDHLKEIDSVLLQREIDHLQWAEGVSSFLLDSTKTSLEVETDENNCKLGRWLADRQSMADVEKNVPKMMAMLEAMKADHARLHHSAAEIVQVLKDNKGDRAGSAVQMTAIYKQNATPALAAVRGTLHDISKVIGDQVKEEELRLQAVLKSTERNIIILTLIALAVGAGVSFFFSRLLSGQIKEAVSFADQLARGDFSKELNIVQKDEIGVLAKALNRIVGSLQSMVGEIHQSSATLSAASLSLAAVSDQLAGGAEQTSGKANTVAAAAEEMSANMESVAAATEQAATNVNMVSAAAEEMTSTINEISRNTAKTSSMAATASAKADQASQRVDELGRSAEEISKVTETITEISEQTNLLALNATIEAARAGEAGKGFAVVANEIKELARQTAQATLEIKNNIEGVQVATRNTVKEINEVSVIIKDVNEMSATVASAVEEQSATTSEIADNVAQASQGIQEVTANIAQVASVTAEIAAEIAEVNAAATELNASSGQIKNNSNDLKDISSNLENMVSNYKI